ncbi:MAG: hypothetical protein KGL40_02715 [Rhodocyclaceae bacterium]|nr:hypothetical protein [Rhodocyclaceae bacterium]
MQTVIKVGLMLASSLLLGGCSETIEWKEEVLLSTGQKIVAARSVERIPAELGHRRATSYEIDVQYPDTVKKVSWEGEFGVSPIMLDFKDGQAFIVALPMMCDAKIKEFSIKEFPYIFMKSSDGRRWNVVPPDEFPAEFKRSNLMASYDEYRIGEGKYQSLDAVSQQNLFLEKATDGFFQVTIPRSPDEWRYKYDKAYKGCAQQR